MGAQPMPMHPGSGYSGPVQNDHVMQQNDDPYLEMGADGMMDPQALEEERMRAEENIYNTHLDAVKEEVQLIQREGEMITTLERAIKNEEDYDMRDYLANARQIAMQKIQMYQQLMQNIDEFQNTFIPKLWTRSAGSRLSEIINWIISATPKRNDITKSGRECARQRQSWP